ncbi:hypothetical protein LTS02_012069 [Friedmanniomyces endolithicus]|uniref:Uncharacterized protein n=1 Tax=Friedmanniomyces simplex TaxID=329884 RepID=A0A4U0WZN9_9PEZI|nr:hypothetical protein LTR75_014304 [Friedmanniomyces endolithicus]KAK0853136.1 hypothetical protein LTS02_012069 [Friedmanniomyces endolithicus]TKA68911.1 hypothetical protein B0A55_07845 [Friedmanniomyces simplex]
MPRPYTGAPPPWLQVRYASTAKPSQPPEPRAFKPIPPSERVSKTPQNEAIEVTKPPKQSLIRRLFSTRPEQPGSNAEPRDITRGLEASQRVVRDGILDARYRPAARRVTAIICALPIAIYLSYELFERRFMGKEQKVRPVHAAREEEGGAT